MATLKRFSLMAVLALVIAFIPALSIIAEEVILTTIMPSQDVLKVKKGVVGLTYKNMSANDIADNELYIEGAVGIGTTAPGNILDIGHYTKTSHNVLALKAESQYDSTIKLMEDSDNFGFDIKYDASGTNNLDFIGHNNNASGVVHMSIERNTGNVGIGTTSPGTYDTEDVRLDVGTNPGEGYAAVDDVYLKNPKSGAAANWASNLAAGIPQGVIVMWSGTLATIPTGWALCNGTSGTPNLTDRFIYGVDTGENPGATAEPTHSHGMGNREVMFGPVTGDISTVYLGGYRFGGSTSSLYAAGGGSLMRRWPAASDIMSSNMLVRYSQTRSDAVTDTASTTPRYFKLAFIMKL